MARLYLSPPDVSERDRESLISAFDSNWITTLGPDVDAFEAELADLVDAPAAVALASGTAALHLALLIAGVGPSDEVIVPTLTFVAPANAVRYVGASLRFVDVEPETWNLDPDLLERVLVSSASEGRRPGAVIVVDLYGQCAQLDRIAELCGRFEVPLIEDAAEALGATWNGRPAGSGGRLGVFSFNGNKIITTGGGGMLVGSEEDIARARHLASQAREPVLHYEHAEVGYNYRLSNLLAGLGRAQLADLSRRIVRRHRINDRYRRSLGSLPGVAFMPWDERGRPNGWLTVMELAPDVADPRELCRWLDGHDIEARPAWKPMHLQPVFDGVPIVGGEIAKGLFERCICLPSGSSMTDEDVDRVSDAVRCFIAGRR